MFCSLVSLGTRNDYRECAIVHPRQRIKLPPEILSCILRHVLELGVRVKFSELEHDDQTISPAMRSALTGQSDLCGALRVSRLFYSCGLPILYERPLLRSGSELHLFATVVMENAALGNLVRSIVIFSNLAHQTRSTFLSTLIWQECHKRTTTRHRIALSLALRGCPFLCCLGLGNLESKSLAKLPHDLLGPLSSRLRCLSLRKVEHAETIISPFNSFPCLEELSLEDVMLDDVSGWPNLPVLRRIRVAGTCHRPTADHVHTRAPLLPVRLPALRTIELSDVVWLETADKWRTEQILYGYADTLNSLQMIGWSIGGDARLMDFSRFTSLQRLVLDPFPDDDSFLLNITPLPPKLTELAILRRFNDPSLMEIGLVDDLLCHLQGDGRPFSCLRHLYIEGHPDIWEQNYCDRLYAACRAQNITLEITYKTPSMYQQFLGPKSWGRFPPMGTLGLILPRPLTVN